jgi:tRNA-intron endonuclease
MSDDKTGNSVSELKTTGVLTEKGVEIAEQSSIDALSQRGYGTAENDVFTLAFYEALYLLDKELLEVKDKKGQLVDFQALLQSYEKTNANAWVNYLVYRDLRSRGYVVREGFGAGTDFRIYDRGAYGKDTASYMVLGTQEVILAVMNRRGETVYYSVSQLTFK